MTARVHAFTDDALGEHDAVGLAEEIRAGRVGRGEAFDAAVARIEKVDPDLNAMVARDYERARTDALAAQGFFAGVPSAVKDNTAVAGLPTQQGSTSFQAHPEPADGDFARMFRRVGFGILGKTQLSEFGFSPSAEFAGDTPPVRNPWHTSYSSGGSSAGAAALVASGALPVAHAVDGGGSIRIPAACCGLVGLKPTRGRVPTDKALREQPVRIVADGIHSRTVRDTAAFLRESEKVYRHLTLPPVGDVRRPGRKRLRVGLVIDSIVGATDHETSSAVRGTAKVLEELGHHVEEVDAPVPASFADDFLVYWGTLAAAHCLNGRRMFNSSFDRRLVDNLTSGLARHGVRNSWRLPLALTRLKRSSRVSAAFFGQYDVVLSPTLARLTPEIGWLDPNQPYETLIERLMSWASFTPLQNATGDPSLSLPLAMSEAGLPIGVLISASQGHEARLLELAYELEEALPFARIDRA